MPHTIDSPTRGKSRFYNFPPWPQLAPSRRRGRSRSENTRRWTMDGYNVRPLALAQVESGTRVSANVQQPTAFAREERRDSVVSAREYHVRQHARPRHVDAFTAEWGEHPRHGRGWVYFAGVIEPSTLMWVLLVAFLIGCVAGLMVEYGEATIEFVRAHG